MDDSVITCYEIIDTDEEVELYGKEKKLFQQILMKKSNL